MQEEIILKGEDLRITVNKRAINKGGVRAIFGKGLVLGKYIGNLGVHDRKRRGVKGMSGLWKARKR